MVAGIVWFSMHKHAEERDRSVRVQNLRECFERREFTAQAAPQRVRTHFFTALVRLDEALKAERVLGWLRHQEISVDWYVNQALEETADSSEEASMIGTALQNAYHEVRRHEILALPAERDRPPPQASLPATRLFLATGFLRSLCRSCAIIRPISSCSRKRLGPCNRTLLTQAR